MLYIIAFLLFAIAVYLFILFIVKKDHGNKEPIGALFMAMGFGFLAVVIAGITNEIFLPQALIDSVSNTNATYQSTISTATLLKASLFIGFNEELLKALPLAVFIYRKNYFNEFTDGVIYFGLSALTFGIIEDVVYSLSSGGGVGITRILFSPYLHVGFTVFFGLSLAYKKVLKKPWWLPVIGMLCAILLHAIYDFVLFSHSPLGALIAFLLTIGLNVMVFVFFRKAQRDDEVRGQSTVGINKYCRHCGKPNPEQLLYCSFCGKLS
ncbi:MAG: PrsW family glutamic-type intramembrane protease [Candidatus Saccharimonadales bacterium]